MVYGLLAEFKDPDALLHAAKSVYDTGYRRLDAYSPFPIHGLAEVIGFRKTILPFLVLGGGIVGCLGGFFMQYYASVIHYPMNVGGRPMNSWPSFIPITFETTILCAALTAVLGMFFLNGFPRPYHPVFNVKQFALASRNKFFLCVEAKDPKFDLVNTGKLLDDLHAVGVYEIDP